jgi:hypothetical protein
MVLSDPPFPAGLRDEAAEHSHRGCLPRTVGSQETEDLALGDVERQVVDRGYVTEFPGEVLSIYQ